MSERNIFHSEPAKGAVIVDATGPNAVLVLDMQTNIGNRYHFEIHNDLEFKPSEEIKAGNVTPDTNLKGCIMQIRFSAARA